jgi:diguanylate cyclase (GGDEF)-like protein
LANHTTLISRDGTEYGIEDSASPIRDTKGKTIGVVLVFHNVTVQREMANEISYRASHDALTGLVNREEFEFKLKQLINDNRETELQSALLYIDLDKFKVINDTCGHSSGDIVLKETANIMGALIRNTDTLARFGGDEFALILHKCGAEKAIIIANNICKSIEEFRFKFNEQSFRIGASIGLVMIDKSWTSDTSLMQAADNACYEAKSSGRNRVHLHFEDDNTLKAHRDDLQWVSRIEHALENDGFELFSQRIIPLQHQGLEHAEILVRMRDKSGSLILPGFFLPTSERFHLITSIDRLVVTKVFEWMRLNDGSLNHIETISINLSGQSLGDVTFHKFILNLIDSVLIDCNKLCFEITETAAITNISGAKKFINAMNGKGVKFSLDDFGSGISSFGYLKNLAVDYLKIDGQFISDLIENKIGQATVRCIAEVASVTGKKTVAEYVENQAVEDMLKEMGIDFIQGFHKHIPSPLDFLLETKCTYLDNK